MTEQLLIIIIIPEVDKRKVNRKTENILNERKERCQSPLVKNMVKST